MVNDIHRKVLQRLVVSWVALSAAIGGTVYYLETEKIDDRVLELAVRESQTLTADTLRLFDRPPEERAPLAAKAAALL